MEPDRTSMLSRSEVARQLDGLVIFAFFVCVGTYLLGYVDGCNRGEADEHARHVEMEDAHR